VGSGGGAIVRGPYIHTRLGSSGVEAIANDEARIALSLIRGSATPLSIGLRQRSSGKMRGG
jgi:hypothetical protein